MSQRELSSLSQVSFTTPCTCFIKCCADDSCQDLYNHNSNNKYLNIYIKIFCDDWLPQKSSFCPWWQNKSACMTELNKERYIGERLVSWLWVSQTDLDFHCLLNMQSYKETFYRCHKMLTFQNLTTCTFTDFQNLHILWLMS